MNVTRLIDKFIDDVCAGKHNETASTYRNKLRQLTRFLHGREITKAMLDQFQKDLLTRTQHRVGKKVVAGGLSIFTVRTTMATTRHLCRWMFDKGYLKQDLAKTIKLPQAPEAYPKAIREDAILNLIKAALTHGEDWERARNIAILYCLRDTGCRVGGLLNIELAGVDLERGIIETHEKGRTVNLFINYPTVQAIRLWLEYRPMIDPQTQHLFISNKTRQGLSRVGVEHLLQRLGRNAGLSERINAHSWRHAFARDFLLNGGELSQLAGILHHSSIWVTTNYYARWDTRELKNAHTKSSPINKLKPMEIQRVSK